MLGRSTGAVLAGVDASLVEVEVDLAGGLPAIAAVGLPDPAVREGIDRLRSALRHTGFALPQHRIVVNLAPAEIRKHGAALDLAIGAALLEADGRLGSLPTGLVVAGELALDGSVRAVRGALAITLAAREAGRPAIMLPRENVAEAALVDGIRILPVGTLADVVAWSRGEARTEPVATDRSAVPPEVASTSRIDLSDVRGQQGARRALELAAAGGHHLLFVGPPGSGKSMLARRLPGILPEMTHAEALAVTRVHGVAGLTTGLVRERPFRAPHHGISPAGLVGGGPRLRPGEMSLASHGVLFLDELTEFRRDALESLRQPVEDGELTVVRVHGVARLPARFQLVASMNPCPCGWLGFADGRCSCGPSAIRRYRARLSGPLLDRFDLIVALPPVDPAALGSRPTGESTAVVRARVVAAHEVQRSRFDGDGCNARMTVADLGRHAVPAPSALRLLAEATARLGLSARAFDRVRRVARTIADLDGSHEVGPAHVAEALGYRGQSVFSADGPVRAR